MVTNDTAILKSIIDRNGQCERYEGDFTCLCSRCPLRNMMITRVVCSVGHATLKVELAKKRLASALEEILTNE